MNPDKTLNHNHYKRFDAIDGLRTYGALGIVLMHILANIPQKPSANLLTTAIIPWFTDFTLLFMVVSGFSVSCGYFEKIKEGAISPLKFYRRRYIRLMPFFALMSTLAFCVSPSMRAAAEAFANITLTNGLLPYVDFNIIGVGWFMGIVMLYYIFFPFIVFLQSNKVKAIATFVAAVFIVWMYIAYSRSGEPIGRRHILYCLPLFLSGGIIYLYREKLLSISRLGHYLLLLLAAASSVLPFIVNSNTEFSNLMVALTVFTFWTLYAVSAQSFYRAGRFSILNNRVTRYLASISLEIYLCHMLFYRVVEYCRLGRIITNNNILYVSTVVLVIGGAVIFSHLVKFHVIDPLVKKYFKS